MMAVHLVSMLGGQFALLDLVVNEVTPLFSLYLYSVIFVSVF